MHNTVGRSCRKLPAIRKRPNRTGAGLWYRRSAGPAVCGAADSRKSFLPGLASPKYRPCCCPPRRAACRVGVTRPLFAALPAVVCAAPNSSYVIWQICHILSTTKCRVQLLKTLDSKYLSKGERVLCANDLTEDRFEVSRIERKRAFQLVGDCGGAGGLLSCLRRQEMQSRVLTAILRSAKPVQRS